MGDDFYPRHNIHVYFISMYYPYMINIFVNSILNGIVILLPLSEAYSVVIAEKLELATKNLVC